MKNPVFVDFKVYDLLGTLIEPGDIVAYSSNSKIFPMRIGVFAGTLLNKKSERQLLFYLIQIYGDSLPITINIDSNRRTPEENYAIDKVIVLNPEYHINNRLIAKAMKKVDQLEDDGIIKR